MASAAVVIAGGQATRLWPYSEERPKALMELAPSVAIVDFIIARLREVGIDEIIVVTRPEQKSAFEEHLAGSASVSVVDGDSFGNLSSVLAGIDALGPRPFLLAMSDHIFEVEILSRLLKADDGTHSILLGVDTEPDHRDLTEGLRVHASQQNVRAVGKTIPPYSGVDVGLFLITRDVRDVASKLNAEKAGKATISDLVNCLAADGEVGYVNVTGRLWLDIDTPDDLLAARRRYREIVRRDLYKATDGPVSRWLNRPISTRISLFLSEHADWATPNVMSVLSFLLAASAALLFVEQQLIIGAILVHLSSIMDGVDGELARLRGRVTAFGGLLDSLLDRLADISLVVAVGFLLAPGSLRLVLTGLAVFGVVLVSYVSQLAAKNTDIGVVRGGFPWATRDVRLFVTTISALALQPIAAIMFCAVAPPVFALKVMLGMVPMKKQTTQAGGKIMDGVRTPIPEISLPDQAGGSGEIRKNAENLIVNLVKGIVAFTALQFARSFAGQLPLQLYLPPPVDVDLLFDVGHLVVLAYFGYKVLIPVKFFMDLASDFVVTKLQITRSMYTRASLDFLYLVILGLSWSMATPIIRRLAGDVPLLVLPANFLFFSITALLLYDMLRTLYRGLRGHWDALMANLTERLSSALVATDKKVVRHDEVNTD